MTVIHFIRFEIMWVKRLRFIIIIHVIYMFIKYDYDIVHRWKYYNNILQ